MTNKVMRKLLARTTTTDNIAVLGDIKFEVFQTRSVQVEPLPHEVDETLKTALVNALVEMSNTLPAGLVISASVELVDEEDLGKF